MESSSELDLSLSKCSWAIQKWQPLPIINTNDALEFTKNLKDNCAKYSLDYETLEPLDPSQIVGVEVEVEKANESNKWKNILANLINSEWIYSAEDNSLKLGGIEFITKPFRAKDLDVVLNSLFLGLPKDHLFSPRTSIHFHLNVRDFTFGQLLSLVYAYTVAETLLYDWIDVHSPPKVSRRNNIYCVPIQQTDIATRLVEALKKSAFPKWAKYTGFNLLPIHSLGTVEFRHLFGTSDRKIVFTWLKMILNLVHWAKTTPYDVAHVSILNLNSNSQYYSFMNEVFGYDLARTLMDTKNVNQKLAKGVSYIKKTMYHNDFFFDLYSKYSASSELAKRYYKRIKTPYNTKAWNGDLLASVAGTQFNSNGASEENT